MKPQIEIFSVSKYYPEFTNIKAIDSHLTLKAAEILKLKLEEESGYTQSHFVYAPSLSLSRKRTPTVSHAINIISGYYAKGMGIIDRSIDEDGKVRVTLSPSAYCDPESIAKGKTNVSVSGGPSPYLPISGITKNGNTYQRLWYCRDGRLTGGCAVEYFIEVPLWEYNGIED